MENGSFDSLRSLRMTGKREGDDGMSDLNGESGGDEDCAILALEGACVLAGLDTIHKFALTFPGKNGKLKLEICVYHWVITPK